MKTLADIKNFENDFKFDFYPKGASREFFLFYFIEKCQ